MTPSNHRVVVFGRTNVGKSTFFNCITEKKQALVSDIEGTTRDCNIATVEWRGFSFELVDTGGIMDLAYLAGKKAETGDIEAKVQEMARKSVADADLVLFFVDNKAGLLPQDRDMALILKKTLPSTDNIILVANKADSGEQRSQANEFFQLSLGEPIAISSATGAGTGDLLDIIIERLKTIDKPIASGPLPADNEIKVCIMGKPNVGKSSLLNAVLGYERVIVSPVAHTTREPQDTDISYNEFKIKLIDTAGISKKASRSTRQEARGDVSLEKHGITKSLETINRADIVLLVLDINQEITHQDAQIVEELVNKKKSIIIVANKWDLVPEKDTKKYTEYIYDRLPFIAWAPIQFVSALTKEKINKIIDLIVLVNQGRKTAIPDSQLNTLLMKIIKIHKPAKGKGLRHPYIYGLTQSHIDPPQFEIRIGAKDNLHFSYVRFIENRLREKFGFTGTPLSLYVGKNKNVHGQHEQAPKSRKIRKFRNKRF